MKDAGILLRLMNKAMSNMALDVSAINQSLGVTDQHLSDDRLRTPHSANVSFWNAVAQASGDPLIGLHLGEHMPVFKGQVLEYLFLSSATFGDGLQRALNYQRLLTDAADAQLDVNPANNEAVLVAKSSDPKVQALDHYNACAIVGLIRFFCYITDNAFNVKRVEIINSLPEEQALIDEYQRVLGCPVAFGKDSNRIFFDAGVLTTPSMHAEPELLQLHQQLAEKYVADLEKQDVINRVNQVIGELLESSEVTLELVASKMGCTARQLRFRLSAADTKFNQLLANYRCHLAKRLLVCTDESIDEIVYLTGFSEPSTFYRAFKRWTGETPIEYRKARSE